MSNSKKKTLKFTYGHQFEPEKFSLQEITELCQDYQPNREQLEQEILKRYFVTHSQESLNQSAAFSNRKKLAMNCFLSLRAYKIIETINNNDKQYQLTKLGR